MTRLLASLAHLAVELPARLPVHPAGRQPQGERQDLPEAGIVTFLLAGLWHGAGWNFVFWGGLHGVGLSVERSCSTARRARPACRSLGVRPRSRALQRVAVFSMVNFAWVFFPAGSIGGACGSAVTAAGRIGVPGLGSDLADHRTRDAGHRGPVHPAASEGAVFEVGVASEGWVSQGTFGQAPVLSRGDWGRKAWVPVLRLLTEG